MGPSGPFFMKKILFLLLLLTSCTKPKTCTVLQVITIKEVRIDSTYVQREYLVELECYD